MLITALDLGSAKIKTLVVEIQKNGKLSLLGVFKAPSAGIRKGEIANIEETVGSLSHIFSEIKRLHKNALKNIFVNVNGTGIKMQNSRGIVAVSRSDNEIYQEDIDRVLKASQAVNLSPNRMVLHTLTKEFIVDGVSDIRDPLGMTGARLEVNSLIIDAFSPAIKNLIKCIEVSGGSVAGLIYGPLSAGVSVLSKAQKELGTVLVDIGFGATGMCVYEEDKLLQAAAIPIGAGNITNDLAIGLKCSVNTAEKIKLSFGCASPKEVSVKEKVELGEFDENLKTVVSRKFLAEIIESRLAEIFEFVNNELKSIGKAGRLPGGAVLTGGGAKMPGIAELAKHELKLSSQVGVPEIKNLESKNAQSSGQIEEPEFSVAAGLAVWAAEQHSKKGNWSPSDNFPLKKILRYFMP